MQVRGGYFLRVDGSITRGGAYKCRAGISGNLRYVYIVYSRSTKDGCIFAIYS